MKKSGYLVDKLHDAPPPYSVKKQSDLYAYKYPHLIYVECKRTEKSLWNIKSNLRESQLKLMLNAVNYNGVKAFVLIWFVNERCIFCISIQDLQWMIEQGYKSINIKKIINGEFRGKVIKEIKNKKFNLNDFERF